MILKKVDILSNLPFFLIVGIDPVSDKDFYCKRRKKQKLLKQD